MFFEWKQDKLILRLYVSPNAKTDEVIGEFEQALKIKIQAPAQENKANQYLVKLMAKWFDVPRTSVTLLKGHQSRHKQIEIQSPKKLPEWIPSNEG